MATANPDHGEGNFVIELVKVRERIKQKFGELIDCVKARECELLKELDSILVSYNKYRNEVEKLKKKKQELIKFKLFQANVKTLTEKHSSEIKEELKSIKIPSKPNIVHFVYDNTRMLAELNTLGKLAENTISRVDYRLKVLPVVSVCGKGKGMEQLHYPWGITVDNNSGNIYVADQSNQCVKMISNSGKFLLKFGGSDVEGKMEYPKGLVICEDTILVTIEHALLHYQLNGKFISRIGKYGKGQCQFKYPYGIAYDKTNGDIYICDNNNHRVQILNLDFTFKSELGVDKLKYPRDVKLTTEYIYILDESNPCFHLYNYQLVLQRSVISRGKGMQIVSPFCFIVDNNNILISDDASDSVRIFNTEFELIHKINTSAHPMGVFVYNKGLVIVVCQAAKDCLQIF